jgi:hypothetical protein
MCPDKAFIPKKDRPPSYDRDIKVSECTIRELARFFKYLRVEIKNLRVAKTSGTFSIKVKPLKRLPDGKLSDLTFQDLLDALGSWEFIISGRRLNLEFAMPHGVKPGK